jgi:hypothetical protein
MNFRTANLFFLLIFPFSAAHPQVSYEYSVLHALAYNHIGNEYWAAGGAGVAEKGLRTSAFNNPAGISFDALTVTSEAGWKSKADYIVGITFNDLTILPTYISVGFPLGKNGLEFGYFNTYNEKVDYGRVEITTVENPDGTGVFFNPIKTTAIHTIFGSFCWQESDNLSFGITFGLDFIKEEEDIYQNSYEISGTRAQIIGGFHYRISEIFELGAVFHIPTPETIDFKIISPGLIYAQDRDDPRTNSSQNYIFAMPKCTAKSPTILETGASVLILPNVTLLASIEYQNWSSLHYDKIDVWQTHAGMAVKLIPEISLRMGYFTQISPFSENGDFFNQQFLSLGTVIKIDNHLAITATALSSDPFKKINPEFQFFNIKESYHQSEFSLGVSYSL